MHRLISGDNMTLGKHCLTAVEIGHEPAGLAAANSAAMSTATDRAPNRRQISRCDEREIERRRTEPSQTRGLFLHRRDFLAAKHEIAAPDAATRRR
jgi:hypothetical protein